MVSFRKDSFYLLIILAASALAQLTLPIRHMQSTAHAQIKNRHLLHLQSESKFHQFQQEIYHSVHTAAAPEQYKLTPHGYYFTLQLQIAGYDYNLNIDTGSSDIFIKGDNAAGNPAKNKRYSCAKCLKESKTIEIGYLDGPLQTYERTLPVKLGSHHFNESILIAFQASKNFENMEGLVGLSFPEIAVNQNPTFIQNLINLKIIDRYAFGVSLNFQNDQSSYITLGSYNEAYFQGKIFLINLQKSNGGYWVDSEGFSVGDTGLLKIKQALFDTGNTCMSFPDKYAESIINQFNKEGINKCLWDLEESAPQFHLLRCKIKDFTKLPTITPRINSKQFPVSSLYYLQRCLPKGQFYYCDTYIESMSGSSSEMLLGDGFFARYYGYFDLKDRKIGLALNKQKLTYDAIKNNGDFDSDDWKVMGELDDSSRKSIYSSTRI